MCGPMALANSCSSTAKLYLINMVGSILESLLCLRGGWRAILSVRQRRNHFDEDGGNQAGGVENIIVVANQRKYVKW